MLFVSSIKTFKHEVLLNLVEKIKQIMSYKFWQIMFMQIQILIFLCPKECDIFALILIF
jgi:hypothetical protein